jgi:hypothetical protein
MVDPAAGVAETGKPEITCSGVPLFKPTRVTTCSVVVASRAPYFMLTPPLSTGHGDDAGDYV